MPASLIFLLIALGFALWWGFILNLVGWGSGWWALARHYRAREPFVGRRFRMCSAKIGWSNYSGCLTFGVSADGLYLALPFPFRPGHPPLFAPWADLEVADVRGWLFDFLDLRFRHSPGVRVRLNKALGLEIAAAANRSWDTDEPPEPDANQG